MTTYRCFTNHVELPTNFRRGERTVWWARRCLMSLLVSLAIGVSHQAHAQDEIKEIQLGDRYCSWDTRPVSMTLYEFQAGKDAHNWMSRICAIIVLPANFKVADADVPSALATIHGQERLILLNPVFLRSIDKSTGTDWGSVSILAHEIAHHLAGHTLQSDGSRPIKELEADRWSGFALAKLGATLEQATSAIKMLPEEQTEEQSRTHPRPSARLVAITNGWNNATEDLKAFADKAKDIAEKKPHETPVKQEPIKSPEGQPVSKDGGQPPGKDGDQPAGKDGGLPQTPSPQIVARIVSPGDLRTFLVMSSNQILVVNPDHSVWFYGVRVPPADPNSFAWDVHTPAERMGVTPDGRVIRYIPGFPAQWVGYVTAP